MMGLPTVTRALKDLGRKSVVYEGWLRRHGGRRGPVIVEHRGALDPECGPCTLVVVCGAEFDQRIPNAATMARMGWCHGFEALGIPYVLASAYELPRVLASCHRPFCWIAGSDYVYLDGQGLKALSQHPHAVLVTTSFDGDEAYFRRNGFPNQAWPRRQRERIAASGPNFLFTMSGESRFEYYTGWQSAGVPLVSLPLACDTHVYRAGPAQGRFERVEVAFVGGFWPYKAVQFDRYLKPHADRLHVFGYSSWPYGHYGGTLSAGDETALYAQARVAPVINEPHVCAMGIDLNERVFKVLGSGGLALTDATPGYREWFSADELLVPDDLADFHDRLNAVMSQPAAFAQVRERGLRAVCERHTYVHRAQTFCRHLGLDLSPTSGLQALRGRA
jgi:hypothetical protein